MAAKPREPGEMKKKISLPSLGNQNGQIYAKALPFCLASGRQHRFFKFCEPNDWLKTGREPGRLSEFVQEQPGRERTGTKFSNFCGHPVAAFTSFPGSTRYIFLLLLFLLLSLFGLIKTYFVFLSFPIVKYLCVQCFQS